jgi:putative endonuclease
MTNNRPTLYTGVTSDLIKRVYQHKHNLISGFTSKYNLHKLVYYENYDSIEAAIIREKQMKDMNRVDKLKMIRRFNPNLEDLYCKILDKPE